MKKIAALFVVLALLLGMTPLTAFAHGHGRGMGINQSYSLCDVENCNTTGTHYHGDTYYYGHSIGDGHDYHRLCNVQGCDLTGTHEHDGVTHFGHYNGDGHSYHNSGGYGYGCHNRTF